MGGEDGDFFHGGVLQAGVDTYMRPTAEVRTNRLFAAQRTQKQLSDVKGAHGSSRVGGQLRRGRARGSAIAGRLGVGHMGRRRGFHSLLGREDAASDAGGAVKIGGLVGLLFLGDGASAETATLTRRGAGGRGGGRQFKSTRVARHGVAAALVRGGGGEKATPRNDAPSSSRCARHGPTFHAPLRAPSIQHSTCFGRPTLSHTGLPLHCQPLSANRSLSFCTAGRAAFKAAAARVPPSTLRPRAPRPRATPTAAAAMNFLLRPPRTGNSDALLRNAIKLLSGPRSRLGKKPRHEKPTARRRREASEAVRRHDRSELLANLRVVLARKARGF
ncbi:hypothetical protein FGB62_1g114 [Gracilaria domingensis]|nr:hypothetical protein FGB62_1g114 [Gracilaria domingensis]